MTLIVTIYLNNRKRNPSNKTYMVPTPKTCLKILWRVTTVRVRYPPQPMTCESGETQLAVDHCFARNLDGLAVSERD